MDIASVLSKEFNIRLDYVNNIIKLIECEMPKKHTTSNKTRKRKGKDMDQIAEDLKPEKAARLLKQEVDFDLPGLFSFLLPLIV